MLTDATLLNPINHVDEKTGASVGMYRNINTAPIEWGRLLKTDRDMRNQIHEALGDEDACFDITAIVDEIQRTHGTVDIDTVPAAEFWAIVNRHYIDA